MVVSFELLDDLAESRPILGTDIDLAVEGLSPGPQVNEGRFSDAKVKINGMEQSKSFHFKRAEVVEAGGVPHLAGRFWVVRKAIEFRQMNMVFL